VFSQLCNRVTNCHEQNVKLVLVDFLIELNDMIEQQRFYLTHNGSYKFDDVTDQCKDGNPSLWCFLHHPCGY